MKLSAAALASRGLVRVRRPGGKWTAELTDAGRYYIEHGDYPPKPEPSSRNARKPRAVSHSAQNGSLVPPNRNEPAATGPTGTPEAEVPLREAVRRPHPAVKELRDRPNRLPKSLRRRCVLIAHSLVTAALERGWTVTPVVGVVVRRQWGDNWARYDTQALLLIDAGYSPVGLVFSEVTKRHPHEDTKEEAARRARGEHVWTSTYDYIPDGRLRLHLTDGNGRKTGTSYTDGARVRVEDRLGDVLAAVEEATVRALRWEEERHRRAEETRLRQQEEERIDRLRRSYEEWEAMLHEGTDAWARHREIADFVGEVERQGGDGARVFVEWARAHLKAVDPRVRVPSGEVPAWTPEQRAAHGRPEPKPRYGW